MSWQITDMPMRSNPKSDFVGWLQHRKTLMNIKVQIPSDTSQENAFLIIQNLAGIISDEGLDDSLAEDGNYV